MRKEKTHLSDEELGELFKVADIDGSGTIEFAEFVQMQLKQERRSTKNLLALAGK